jgi:hypothetical protein
VLTAAAASIGDGGGANNNHHRQRLPAIRDHAGGRQGLTLVHFSAQLERFVWDGGAHTGGIARVRGCSGCVGWFVCVSHGSS